MRGLQQSDVVELAEWLDVKKDWWSAARLWDNLARQYPSVSCQCRRNAIQALEHIPSGSQPGAVGLEFEVRKFLRFFTDVRSEKDVQLEWMISLIDDPVRSKQLLQVKDPQGSPLLAAVRNQVGVALIGCIVSKAKFQTC